MKGISQAFKSKFFGLANRLSPENLSCDGECSRAQTQTRYRNIMREWAALERAVGRKVTLEEVEEAEFQHYRNKLGSQMSKKMLARELMHIAKSLLAVKSYSFLRDLRTKSGTEFKAGETITLTGYDQSRPYLARLETSDGRKLALSCEYAYKVLRGFPKPPSFMTMQKWMDDAVAKAVDGSRVEPDGIASSGAPSWLLVMGMI